MDRFIDRMIEEHPGLCWLATLIVLAAIIALAIPAFNVWNLS